LVGTTIAAVLAQRPLKSTILAGKLQRSLLQPPFLPLRSVMFGGQTIILLRSNRPCPNLLGGMWARVACNDGPWPVSFGDICVDRPSNICGASSARLGGNAVEMGILSGHPQL